MRAEAQAHVDQIRSALELVRRFLDWDRALKHLEGLNAKVEDPTLWDSNEDGVNDNIEYLQCLAEGKDVCP